MGVTTRLAERRDAEAIRAIFNREVAGSTAVFDLVPRTPADQLAWLEEHSGAHPALAAVDADGEVVGFGSLSSYRPRPAYSTTVESSVYVHHEWRSHGVGRALLEELVRLGRAHGFHTIIARIVDGNEASITLHRACGFRLVGVEREIGRKFGRWLDVVEMQRMV